MDWHPRRACSSSLRQPMQLRVAAAALAVGRRGCPSRCTPSGVSEQPAASSRLWQLRSDVDALFSSFSTHVQGDEPHWDDWLYEQNMMWLAHCYRGGARSGGSGRYSRLLAPLPGGTSRPRRGVARSHALVASGSPEAEHELDRVSLAPSTNSTISAFSTAERVHDELSRAPSSVPTVGSVLAHTTPEGYPGTCSYSSHHGPSHDAMRSFISSDPPGVLDVDTYWDGESTESTVATSHGPALKR